MQLSKLLLSFTLLAVTLATPVPSQTDLAAHQGSDVLVKRGPQETGDGEGDSGGFTSRGSLLREGLGHHPSRFGEVLEFAKGGKEPIIL